ncbi:hypothetical protein [Microbulbifer thermotolerans]|uniref:Uncharacterized protein n=1 Tax=Microbulbifer thermotolerans TaxID=252514 RepID=A0AB35HZB4_MICTH|nr:hypothetical protein [Microbulbifer thermotolerans]MCX2780407.1 hypothetical protein [Microbulbifer thermotolerans]MCX2802241.1 hypothetical protein [Microbulbifer thermotolerans]MCX2805921.1 hypothetical protein [Microbulbifer thermotolerans]
MNQRDGFDFIREAQRRMAEEAREDNWETLVIQALGLIVLGIVLVGVSAGWLW